MDITTQIVNRILNLKSGSTFVLDVFLDEYKIPREDKLFISMAILKRLEGKVEVIERYKNVAGLPFNLPRIKL